MRESPSQNNQPPNANANVISVGYVEFYEVETVTKAIALTGTKLLGIPVMISYTEAEKNRQAQAGGGDNST